MLVPLLVTLALSSQDAQPVPPSEEAAEAAAPTAPEVSLDDLRAAARVVGLELTDAELAMMRPGVLRNREAYVRMQRLPLDNALYPALVFDPLLPGVELRARPLDAPAPIALPEVTRPADLAELCWADVPTLASLVRSRQVSCVELVEVFLARLVRLDEQLRCVVSLCEERAYAQAEALDAELDEGRWRGLLHGIPYGAKDLFAVRGTRTTWGARPFVEQRIELDATAIERLDGAGAVLVAKLSLGALAMGDVWFDATTRNPWNLGQGSSGSSAGSAAATAAGCLPFALGTETLGSIVSPSSRCGNSSLRPTFGRVSRHGAMALAWSMDKVGPLCRSFTDAAIVFDAIRGPDGKDPSVKDLPFRLSGPVDVTGWRVGVPEGAFEARGRRSQDLSHVLDELEALGVELVPVALPELSASDLMVILDSETATAFDALTRDGRDDELVRQTPDAWPNLFRTARTIPAVEYLRANRLRTLLCREMDALMSQVELLVHPSFAGGLLGITNLTGHPCAVAPAGFSERGTPYSVSFTGQLYGEERLLALVQAWQAATEHHRRHPELD